VSWRRWPDPVIDFGSDLYRVWRISQGAVLYRDVDIFYGPLSQYINATIFSLFGAGMMHLVWANLAIFGAIVVTLYCLLRRAWGAGAALFASAVFVLVFGFSHLVGISNYTYAAPYSHECTHGLLVLLLLVGVLARWLESPTRLREFSAGILLGLTAVLKIEILFAGLLLTMAALALRWRRGGHIAAGSAGVWAMGGILPTILFFGYFARHLCIRDACGAACHAWLNFSATADVVATDPVQLRFLGFDRPWANLVEHIEATLMAAAIVALILIFGKVADRQRNPLTGGLIGAAVVAVALAVAWAVAWLFIGSCLLGLIMLYLTWYVIALARSQSRGQPFVDLRILFAVLAASLMARMVLQGRIYQFGFYQAAIAGTVVPAVLLGESVGWANVQRRGRWVILSGFLALLSTGVAMLTAKSQWAWRLKTYAVGEGADRFYTFPPAVRPIGEVVSQLTDFLSRQSGNRSLLVLPEGLMVNYLTRLPSPLAPIYYFSVYTEHGREAKLVDELRRQPPDLVVVISRDLRENGINRYGESIGKGQLLVQWVNANYTVILRIGGDPLDFRQAGAVVLRKSTTANANGP
jgi:hypothetical protein